MALIKILGAQSFTLLKKKYSQFSRYLLIDHFLEGITAIKSLVVHTSTQMKGVIHTNLLLGVLY